MAYARRPIANRFWEKVDKRDSDDCWEWIGLRNQDGYGRIIKGGKYSRLLSAHRVSWEIHNSPIPDGMQVLHHCDNPGCVNPNHLFLGTQADNIRDMHRKGRRRYDTTNFARGERQGGSRLTGQDVREIRCFLEAGYSQAEIARGYSVCQASISHIATGRDWAWLNRYACSNG